ncbi:ABC transporter permease [Clostridium paraputrificum]|uniref:ABC transporter permease n=1 Tax=Clostridium paraputrificum TaxID=29363 RepID=UPI003D33FF62
MNFLIIAKYRLIQSWRDKQSLISMMLVPIFLILILGNALKSNEDFTARNIDKVNVLYVNNGTGEGSKTFEDFINREELKEIIEPNKIDNIEEGKSLIESRKYDALVLYDESLEGKLQVVGSDYNELGVSIVKSVVDTYSSSANTYEALAKINAKDFSFIKHNNLSEETITVSGKKPSSIDYYAITMLVMIIMYGSIYGNFAIDKSYYGTVGNKIKSAPVKLGSIFIGEGIGVVLTIMLQVIVLLLVSNFAFGVNFGNSIPLILLVSLSLSVLSTLLGMLACMVTKKGLIGLALLNVLVPILTFLSGGFVKVNFSGIIGGIAKMTPNYLATNAIFKDIYGGANTEVYLSILGIWIISAILFVGAMEIGRREKI